MPVQDRIVKYSIYVAHNDIADFQRVINLKLESGSSATIAFPKDPPNDWLQFSGSQTTLYMAQGEFASVFRLLQAESPFVPVFFTALNLLGIRVGAVHTQLDLSQSAGGPAGIGEEPPRTLHDFIRRADQAKPSVSPPENRHPEESA